MDISGSYKTVLSSKSLLDSGIVVIIPNKKDKVHPAANFVGPEMGSLQLAAII